jgi:SAM-dependent methyltransferase
MTKSYTSQGRSPLNQLCQIVTLSRFYSERVEERASIQISEMQHAERSVREVYGVELRRLTILEIGPGQFLGQLPYLALFNKVVGVDLDVVAQGLGVRQYVEMLLKNGPARTIKTIGRKAMGIDRRYRAELRKMLDVAKLPAVEVRSADVMNLPFAGNTFDFVYSRALFQHLRDPAGGIREISRVLKIGGIAYISLQPYTSPTGCLDPRVLYGGIENELGLWPHLRPELKEDVRPMCPLNKLGLRDWKSLFNSECEAPHFTLTKVQEPYFPLANDLKQAGHLKDYSVEELTTGALDVMFRNGDETH